MTEWMIITKEKGQLKDSYLLTLLEINLARITDLTT